MDASERRVAVRGGPETRLVLRERDASAAGTDDQEQADRAQHHEPEQGREPGAGQKYFDVDIDEDVDEDGLQECCAAVTLRFRTCAELGQPPLTILRSCKFGFVYFLQTRIASAWLAAAAKTLIWSLTHAFDL